MARDGGQRVGCADDDGETVLGVEAEPSSGAAAVL